MRDILELNCWILGDELRSIFAVEIATSRVVAALKDAIKKERTRIFNNIDACDLNLWKVNIDPEIYEDLLATIKVESDIPDGKLLDPLANISEVLHDAPYGHINIIAVLRLPTTDTSTGDDMAKRRQMHKAQTLFVQRALTRPSPSQSAKASNFAQEQSECPILVGQPVDKQGLPVGLYNHIFDEFKSQLSDPAAETDITPDQLAVTFEFCAAAVAIYENAMEQREAMQEILADILHAPMPVVPAHYRANSEGTILTNAHGLSLCRAILEWKNDMGGGGCDPINLGYFSFRNIWIQKDVKRARDACSCPSFVIVIAGPWMSILGGVFLEFPVIQPLTDYIWLGVDASADRQLIRVTRVLLALRNALHSLELFYTQLNIPTDPTAPSNLARFFPNILSYPIMNGEVRFEYVDKLVHENFPPKAIFKAKIVDSGEHIVVKFVQRYNFTAHRLLAAHNLAPPLLYPTTAEHEPVREFGGLKLVVMGYVDGVTACEYDNAGALPNVIFTKIEQAISVLHRNRLVFGDLRLSNIMVSREQVVLVDFDWCAEDGVGRYPVSLNDIDQDIGWHPDVKRGGIMRKEHDLHMLEKFRC